MHRLARPNESAIETPKLARPTESCDHLDACVLLLFTDILTYQANFRPEMNVLEIVVSVLFTSRPYC